MALEIFNTLGRKKEKFKSLKKNEVSFYQCGPTVYWTQHIGNIRAMVLADLIRRSLEYLGYQVKMTRNYTDVGHMTSDSDEGEDKMDQAAQREKKSPAEIAQQYIDIFENDVRELNIEEPQFKPRATETIDEIKKAVKELLDHDFAYITDWAVYFDTTKAKNYHALSGQKAAENRAEAGKGDVSDPRKKNPADFALWFFKTGVHQNALQTWPNRPVKEEGEGFPGWHIECSVMSKKYLGERIDFHMGGIEHIPVHHTNEIAQSEALTGKKFVNYWLHNEHLTVNGGKMSKSTGTAFSLAQIKEKGYDPLVLRYFFLQSHYRSKQNFTWEALDSAKNGLNNLYHEISQYFPFDYTDKELDQWTKEAKDIPAFNEWKEIFVSAVNDDFNIPGALGVVYSMLENLNPPSVKIALVIDFDQVLGLDIVRQIRKNKNYSELISDDIKKIAEERLKAKKNKDFIKADELRAQIEKSGFAVEDTADGYRLKRRKN